jgi:hypothetical protein
MKRERSRSTRIAFFWVFNVARRLFSVLKFFNEIIEAVFEIVCDRHALIFVLGLLRREVQMLHR